MPEAARRQVHALTDGLTASREKIRVLYRFLQQNTHYVGIELGIGGWQPYDAAYVYNKKYGDCKALSNYMVALLKEAGIRAYPVLIRGGAGQPSVDTGFACVQFNHEIAVAFTGKDTVWLECTSSSLPAGYLGSFTADREGLLLDENGGHLIHTPVYGAGDNRLIRWVKGSIDDQGDLQASLQTIYSGLDQDYVQYTLNNSTKKELLDERREALGLNNCVLGNLRDSSWQSTVPVLDEQMHLTADQYATLAGNRLLIVYSAFMKRLSRLSEEPGRKNGFELSLSQEESDSLVLQLPQGWTPEEQLPSARFSATFGSYSFTSRFENGLLTLVSDFRQYKGLYPPAEYARLVRFFNLVYREAYRQLVFIKAPPTARP
ncbi:MAG TPA: transglutaminase-like domain-containing protein [Puia sp.]|nr:transglutaminase-like domain-containing protein [Puia sp.]